MQSKVEISDEKAFEDYFDSIESAIEDIANGKMIVVVDDEDRENEGDLLMAAHFVTPDAINFMIKYGKGLVCLPLSEQYLQKFQLNNMVPDNQDPLKTAFTVSIDASTKHGVTTGISAADRAKTIQVILDPNSSADDIQAPGHIFPLRSREMGVLRRAGHTEAAVDLARLAGSVPAGVICEIINDDGSMARGLELVAFAKTHNLKLISIQDLIQYRVQKERFVKAQSRQDIQTPYGQFELITYEDTLNNQTHYALVKGKIQAETATWVRVHAASPLHDLFGAGLDKSEDSFIYQTMKRLQDVDAGVLLYMTQNPEYHESESSCMIREYGVGAQILLDLGVRKMHLITNRDSKVVGLSGFGLEIIDRIPLGKSPKETQS